MADPATVHSDLELWGLAWYRARIAELKAEHPVLDGFEVERVEPPPGEPFPKKLLVFRDDSGPGTLLTAERAIGLSVLMDTKLGPLEAKAAAAIFLGLVWTMPEPGDGTLTVGALPARNPVAAVTEVNGPYMVPEDQDRARAYGTATITVTPVALAAIAVP